VGPFRREEAVYKDLFGVLTLERNGTPFALFALNLRSTGGFP
jgi:hypothetical protein